VIRAIFWDNDGILADTETLYLRATAEVLASRGLALNEDDYRRHYLVAASGLAALVPGATAATLARLRAERDAIYAGLLATEEIAVPGAAETLAALRGRVVMGVVTSSLREHFDLIHARTGFLPCFDFVLASGDYAETKPHPAPYLAAMERVAARHGVGPAECLAVEDSGRGLSAAKAAGLRTWVIPGALSLPGDLAGADRILGSIREIPGLLDGETPG